MQFETVMGFEVHAELATKTKVFCGCPNEFGGEPNTHVCPVCLEALWRRPVAFFADAGRGRACPHFLHATCAAQIARHSDRCPTCRAPFARPRAMPPLDYADLAWVSTLCNSEGGVRRRDACAALAAQFPFDRAAVEDDLPWDAWGGDVLDAAKLCDVRTGLKAALLGPLPPEPVCKR